MKQELEEDDKTGADKKAFTTSTAKSAKQTKKRPSVLGLI